MMTPSEFAATIKAARRALKLTQAELAAAAGVGIRFVVELEAGKPTVQLGKSLAVLDALGLECRIESRAEAQARLVRR